MGQQRWLRTLNIEHHQVLAGTDASMAPGFENEEALKRSKSDRDYWANKPAAARAKRRNSGPAARRWVTRMAW